MTAGSKISAFNLPYNQSDCYWLAVFPGSEVTAFPGSEYDALHAALTQAGMNIIHRPETGYIKRCDGEWVECWGVIAKILREHQLEHRAEIALIPGDAEPGLEEFSISRKSLHATQFIAESLWLGEAMLEDRIVCYMQPVLDKRNKVFGYEAFARIETAGEPIGGGKIIEASRGLNAEYTLDRHLHVKAVTSFISSDLEGFLFINFQPGFIHRPEKYLEGLSEAARFHGMPAKQIVLDFTHSETERDIVHYKAIFDYCRTKGYSLSLDDIASVAMTKKIMETIRPDFIKLDRKLVRDAQSSVNQPIVEELVSLAHSAGVTVLAEGVETEDSHKEMLKSGVDLFQGYLFSAPVAVSTLKKAAG